MTLPRLNKITSFNDSGNEANTEKVSLKIKRKLRKNLNTKKLILNSLGWVQLAAIMAAATGLGKITEREKNYKKFSGNATKSMATHLWSSKLCWRNKNAW